MLQNQFANVADKMFEQETAKIVRKHSFWASICALLPLFGFELIPFCIILWHMYSKLCQKAGTNLNFSNIGVGYIVNILAYIVIGTLFYFFPIGWLGKSFTTYLQFYLSGKAFIETIKALHPNSTPQSSAPQTPQQQLPPPIPSELHFSSQPNDSEDFSSSIEEEVHDHCDTTERIFENAYVQNSPALLKQNKEVWDFLLENTTYLVKVGDFEDCLATIEKRGDQYLVTAVASDTRSYIVFDISSSTLVVYNCWVVDFDYENDEQIWGSSWKSYKGKFIPEYVKKLVEASSTHEAEQVNEDSSLSDSAIPQDNTTQSSTNESTPAFPSDIEEHHSPNSSEFSSETRSKEYESVRKEIYSEQNEVDRKTILAIIGGIVGTIIIVVMIAVSDKSKKSDSVKTIETYSEPRYYNSAPSTQAPVFEEPTSIVEEEVSDYDDTTEKLFENAYVHHTPALLSQNKEVWDFLLNNAVFLEFTGDFQNLTTIEKKGEKYLVSAVAGDYQSYIVFDISSNTLVVYNHYFVDFDYENDCEPIWKSSWKSYEGKSIPESVKRLVKEVAI